MLSLLQIREIYETFPGILNIWLVYTNVSIIIKLFSIMVFFKYDFKEISKR